MLCLRDDLWNMWDFNQAYVCVPTNGDVRKDGEAVMGRGLALQVKIRFQRFPLTLGQELLKTGNRVVVFPAYRLITFPVKEHWHENARLDLIERSAKQLVAVAPVVRKFPIYLPKVGCGNGGLDWKDVRPVLEANLDDRFVVCDVQGE